MPKNTIYQERKGVIAMDENVIRVSESALKAVLLVFDAIEEADKGYQACQCSTCRSFVDIRQEAAQSAYEEIRYAIKKSPKKGVAISIQVAQRLLSIGDSIDSADGAYPNNNSGNLNYRSYLRSVHDAQLNLDAVAAVRGALEARQE